jgi:hypothetical protein
MNAFDRIPTERLCDEQPRLPLFRVKFETRAVAAHPQCVEGQLVFVVYWIRAPSEEHARRRATARLAKRPYRVVGEPSIEFDDEGPEGNDHRRKDRSQEKAILLYNSTRRAAIAGEENVAYELICVQEIEQNNQA